MTQIWHAYSYLHSRCNIKWYRLQCALLHLWMQLKSMCCEHSTAADRTGRSDEILSGHMSVNQYWHMTWQNQIWPQFTDVLLLVTCILLNKINTFMFSKDKLNCLKWNWKYSAKISSSTTIFNITNKNKCIFAIMGIHYTWKYIKIENNDFHTFTFHIIFHNNYCIYCIFDQVNAALMSK